MTTILLSLVLVLPWTTSRIKVTLPPHKRCFVHLNTVTLITHLHFLRFLLAFEYHHSGNFPLNSSALHILSQACCSELNIVLLQLCWGYRKNKQAYVLSCSIVCPFLLLQSKLLLSFSSSCNIHLTNSFKQHSLNVYWNLF